jgi:hypothetical protein
MVYDDSQDLVWIMLEIYNGLVCGDYLITQP